MRILIAKRENGTLLSLSHAFSKDDLKRLARSESLSCPICSQRVHAKLGSIKRWHFAHEPNSNCVAGAAETADHLDGKLQLYLQLQLVKNVKSVELEPFLADIQQRPDVLFHWNGGRVVIEYQCSAISSEKFLERTTMYQKINIRPIWIFSINQLKQLSWYRYRLSALHWLAAQAPPQQLPRIHFYDSTKRQLLLLRQIVPLSASSVYARATFIPLSQLSPDHFNEEAVTFHKEQLISATLHAKQNWRKFRPRYSDRKLRALNQAVYRKTGCTLPYVPAIAGVPVLGSEQLAIHPILWQTWFLVEALYHVKEGSMITKTRLIAIWNRLNAEQKIPLRQFVFIKEDILHPLFSYLDFLVTMNVLKKQDEHAFMMCGKITFPRTLQSALEEDKAAIEAAVNKMWQSPDNIPENRKKCDLNH